MLAFAANSLLCRAALTGPEADAAGFTLVRIGSGALVLMLIWLGRRTESRSAVRGSWLSSAMLLLYAAAFSFAYLELPAGTGALLLFGAVQVTMIFGALLAGERLRMMQWLGILLAFGGMIYLLLPGVEAPPVGSALIMLLSGLGWGVYSLRGKKVADPLAETAWNFLRALPAALILFIAVNGLSGDLSQEAFLLAIVSGAITSGLGYAIWYAVLPSLPSSQASVVQLSVPVLAAFAGWLLLGESLTGRLLWSSTMVLGGILLVIKFGQGSRQDG